MKKLMAVAAMLLATSAAQASESFSFKIGGQSIYVDAPRDCTSASCISVSIPGVYEHNVKRKRNRDGEPVETETAVTPERAPQPAPTPAPIQSSPSLEPANGPATATKLPVTEPGPATAAVAPAPEAQLPAAAPAPGLQPDAAPAPAAPPASSVIATAPAAAPVQRQLTTIADSSPIGLWITEKKEGKVRIEACGNNLCGYSVNAKTDQNGQKVLINMKPTSNKWTGRIYDPNSGSTYDSTIALKGPDVLRVQGCAFGGMFCGGQTWSRVN